MDEPFQKTFETTKEYLNKWPVIQSSKKDMLLSIYLIIIGTMLAYENEGKENSM